jgi:TolB protein
VTVPAQAAEAPSLSRDGRRLAYEARASRSTLRKVAFDARTGTAGGVMEELWSTSRDLSAPRLSADGRSVVLWGGSGVEQIAITSLDGTIMRQLFESDRGARHPRFSPDGQRVAFFSGRSGNPQIWEIHADGSGLKQLTDFADHQMFYPLYSPDGSRLEAIDEKGGTWILDRSRPDAKWTPTHKPVAGDLLPDGNFSWSRDGRFFAGDFIDQAYNRLGIYVESVETGERRRLTEKGRRPVWLSDDRRILYQREGAIWIVDSATGKTSEILPALKTPRAILGFDLAPDESFLLLLEQTAESDIWLRAQD